MAGDLGKGIIAPSKGVRVNERYERFDDELVTAHNTKTEG